MGEHVPVRRWDVLPGPHAAVLSHLGKGGGSMRRMIALTMISVCVAGGATECGGGGSAGQQSGGSQSSGAQSSGTEQAMTVLRQLARCIRSHGMPSFPGPIINPLTNQPASRQPRRTPQPAPSRPASPSNATPPGVRPHPLQSSAPPFPLSQATTPPGEDTPPPSPESGPPGPASGLDLGRDVLHPGAGVALRAVDPQQQVERPPGHGQPIGALAPPPAAVSPGCRW